MKTIEHKGKTFYIKIAACLAASLVYLAGIFFLRTIIHDGALFLTFLPVIAMGFAFGNPQAIIAAAVCSALNLVFYEVFAQDLKIQVTIFAKITGTAGLILGGAALGYVRDLTTKLKKAISEIRTLSGLLPMCAGCKKIRNDEGYWAEVEEYISTRSDTTFSHGLCPDCLKKHMPEYFDILEKRNENGQNAK
jgi:hypothetical protein